MKKGSKLLRIIWWAYLITVFLLIAVKYNGSLLELSERIRSYEEAGFASYNLTPFKSIRVMLSHVSNRWGFLNLYGNIIPFLPFGFLLPLSYEKKSRFRDVFFMGLLFVVFIEIFQLITRLGIFDVDDIILNMAGISIGYVFYKLIHLLTDRGDEDGEG